MTAAMWKLLIEQGTTFRTVLTLKDSAGVPVDLTGASARLQVRETVDSPTPLLELSTADPPGGITIDGPAGQLTLAIADEDTAAMTWHHGVYDLEVATAGGETTRLLKGAAVVDREVTR